MNERITAADYKELVAQEAAKPRKNKWNAVRTTVDGITFDSKGEARRYIELKLRERSGEIFKLELQPVFPLLINGTKCGVWKGDFAYFHLNERVIEDFKGYDTPLGRLKRKIVEALYGIKIRITVAHSDRGVTKLQSRGKTGAQRKRRKPPGYGPRALARGL